MEKTTEQQVFRQVAFPVSAFDYLKDFQRGYERKHGVRLTNNQALTIIINEHQKITVESEEHVPAGSQARP